MQRRRFFTVLCLVLAWSKSLLAEGRPIAFANEQGPVAAGSGFLAVLDKILPLVDKLLEKIFGGAKQKGKEEARNAIEQFANELKMAVLPVNEDVRHLTAWRKISSNFDGPMAIKDAVIEIRILVDNTDQFSDAGLMEARSTVIRLVEETTGRLQTVVNEATLEQIPVPDRAPAKISVSSLASNLKRISEEMNRIKNVTDPKRMRETFSRLGILANTGISNCEALSFYHQEYQIRLSDDFFKYIERFGGIVESKVRDESKFQTAKTLGSYPRIPLADVSDALEDVIRTLKPE